MAGMAVYYNARKNPEERNIRGLETMIASNSGKEDPYGTSGLANLPMSFALGRANRNAENYDKGEAVKRDTFMNQQLQQNKKKQNQEAKQATITNWLNIAKQDVTAANAFAANTPVLKDNLPPGMTLKEPLDDKGWTSVEFLSGDGKTKKQYQINMGGLPEAGKRFAAEGGQGAMTAKDLEKFMPPGWMLKFNGASKAPSEEPAGQNTDRKEFSTWATKYNGLMKAKATVERGYDPITNEEIPESQLDAAKATLNEQIIKTERYMQATFPGEWKAYAGGPTPEATAQPRTAPNQAPMTAVNPKTGQKIISRDGGMSWEPME